MIFTRTAKRIESFLQTTHKNSWFHFPNASFFHFFIFSFFLFFILSFSHSFIFHIRSGHKKKAPKLVRGSLVYRKRLLHQDFDFVELFPARHSNTSITLLSLNQDLSSFLYVDSFLRIDNPAALEVEVFSFL